MSELDIISPNNKTKSLALPDLATNQTREVLIEQCNLLKQIANSVRQLLIFTFFCLPEDRNSSPSKHKRVKITIF